MRKNYFEDIKVVIFLISISVEISNVIKLSTLIATTKETECKWQVMK